METPIYTNPVGFQCVTAPRERGCERWAPSLSQGSSSRRCWGCCWVKLARKRVQLLLPPLLRAGLSWGYLFWQWDRDAGSCRAVGGSLGAARGAGSRLSAQQQQQPCRDHTRLPAQLLQVPAAWRAVAGLRCCFSPAGVPAGAARALLSWAAAQETGPEMDLYPPIFSNSIIFPSLGWAPMRELFVPLRWQPPIFGKSGVCFFPRFWLQSCLALHGCPTGNLQPRWGSGCAKLGHSGKGGLSLLLFLLVSPSERIPVQGEIFFRCFAGLHLQQSTWMAQSVQNRTEQNGIW